MPGKPGPRGGTSSPTRFVRSPTTSLSADPSLRPVDLVEPIEARFGVRVHPRSIERALARYREQQSKSR